MLTGVDRCGQVLTGAGGDLIFDKWLLVKLPVCAKYVNIISSTANDLAYSNQ